APQEGGISTRQGGRSGAARGVEVGVALHPPLTRLARPVTPVPTPAEPPGPARGRLLWLTRAFLKAMKLPEPEGGLRRELRDAGFRFRAPDMNVGCEVFARSLGRRLADDGGAYVVTGGSTGTTTGEQFEGRVPDRAPWRRTPPRRRGGGARPAVRAGL